MQQATRLLLLNVEVSRKPVKIPHHKTIFTATNQLSILYLAKFIRRHYQKYVLKGLKCVQLCTQHVQISTC